MHYICVPFMHAFSNLCWLVTGFPGQINRIMLLIVRITLFTPAPAIISLKNKNAKCNP